MDYDLIDQAADRGFLYFKGRIIEELGQGLRVEVISHIPLGRRCGRVARCLPFLLGCFLGVPQGRIPCSFFNLRTDFFAT